MSLRKRILTESILEIHVGSESWEEFSDHVSEGNSEKNKKGDTTSELT
jgi:hypothetical protein